MLSSDARFGTQAMLLDIEIGDLVGEILGFDGDSWQEIRQWSAIGNAETDLHILCRPTTEEGDVALAYNSRERLIAFQPLKDNPGELFLRLSKLFASANPLGFCEALLKDFLAAR